MNIALLNDEAFPVGRGGTGVVVARLRQMYRDAGHETLFITSHSNPARGPLERTEDTFGPIASIHRSYDLRKRHRLCMHDEPTTTAIANLLQEFRPDAVHAHNLHMHLTYDALNAAKKFTNRVFLTANDVFLVAFNRVNTKRYFESVIRNTPYRMHSWEHLAAVGRKYWPLRNTAIRRILRESGTTVVAISNAQKEFLEANGIRVGTVIYNGVPPSMRASDAEAQAFRQTMNLTGPTILFGGRIRADKGIFAIFQAFDRVLDHVPTAHLLLVTDNKRVEGFLPAATPRVRAAARCTGWIPATDLPVAYAAATVVTTPSLCLDPFNLMNAEAMMAGKPVVGTIFGGTPEIVEHGVTGYVCDPRDTKEYARYLVDVLTEPAKAAKMGEAGKKRAEEKFSLERQGEEYLKLFATG